MSSSENLPKKQRTGLISDFFAPSRVDKNKTPAAPICKKKKPRQYSTNSKFVT